MNNTSSSLIALGPGRSNSPRQSRLGSISDRHSSVMGFRSLAGAGYPSATRFRLDGGCSDRRSPNLLWREGNPRQRSVGTWHSDGRKPHGNVRMGHRARKRAILAGFVSIAGRFCICAALIWRGIGTNPGVTTTYRDRMASVALDCMI